ncbi:phosphate regulon transcriptional regulator PhoB [Rhodoferax sp. GW822-FHT02A01]|uniref:phosphate regulon transcriptional regulator PhoB n=1 Tax=Rhodoferax sp. GW822-FHT02A01 TaxID=3141537 RepID=UPI00315DC21C
MAGKILVVDDDRDIQELVAVNLSQAGHVVQVADDAEIAHAIVREELPDLVLIDWMLPGMSGIELTRLLRSEVRTRDVPIIMLTARDDERDKITGFENGADDYVVKPFSPRLLLARIAAILRRRTSLASEQTVEVGALRLDAAARRIYANGQLVVLGPTEYRLMHFFMLHVNRVFSRAQLLDSVWGDQYQGDERTVDVHIRRLRVALTDGNCSHMIKTLRGSGYCLSLSII